MAIVNYSVPDAVKAAFDTAFAGENKSAVIARLMTDAVAHKQRLARRVRAVAALLEIRKRHRPATDDAIRRARRKGRP